MKAPAEKLRELVRRILAAAGVSTEKATLVSGNLVESNLVGHDSHGIIRLPRYIKAIREGRLQIDANPHIVRESLDNAVLDGNWGFGQVAATEAMDLAIEKAGALSVASASVFNCNDVGRLGAYPVRAAEHNCIGVMTVNDGGANPLVAPWGGRSRLFSTNPISVAIPTGGHPPICVDMATSVVAGGKVQVAQKRRQQLPPGCFITSDGRPSTEPDDFYMPHPGALLPLGAPVAGHKGFGLGLVVDILSGALSGAGCSGSAERDAQGLFILVINIAAFTPLDEFIERTTGLIEAIRSSPKAEGVSEILIPGEPEWREKEKRLREGIFVEDATWQEIMEIAGQFQVEGDSI